MPFITRGKAEQMHRLHNLSKDEYVRRAEDLQARAHFESIQADRTKNPLTEDLVRIARVRNFANHCAKLLVMLKHSERSWEWPEYLMRLEYWSNLAAEETYMIKRHS